MKHNKKNIYTSSNEICKKCGKIMLEVSHKEIKHKQLRQPFYYSKWYVCECNWRLNKESDKVWNTNQYAQYVRFKEEEQSLFSNLRIF